MLTTRHENLKILALSLPRRTKQGLAISVDVVICVAATLCALGLRLEGFGGIGAEFLTPALLSVGIALPVFVASGLYQAIFRFSGGRALRALAKAVATYGALYALIVTVVGLPGVPRSIGLMQPMLMFLSVGATRWAVRNWLGRYLLNTKLSNEPKKILIYGCGRAGRQLANAVQQNTEFELLGFVDDEQGFWGGTIEGQRVYPPAEVYRLVEIKGAKEIWLAFPSGDGSRRREVVEALQGLRIHVRTLPTLSDLANGRVRVSDVRELDLNELLGRPTVQPNPLLIQRNTIGKVVLVTGAGGSIGSELCRQILANKPNRLVLVENSEYALYRIHAELRALVRKHADAAVIPVLADVGDEAVMRRVFSDWRPNVVYHAAAYKHVPLVETNVSVGVENNVFGTWVCAQAAMQFGVRHFILVSTDKAVRPANVMGASKRLAEMALQALADDLGNASTCFAMVRFGNVLGSSGSVIPLFNRQIEAGGPVTLTHEAMTRYFMTIPEAAQLVIQAGAMAKGGEVFVLDMGQPVRIAELARGMIQAKGMVVRDAVTPWGDIEIKVTGLRPGEKLYEELLIGEGAEATEHPRILKANEPHIGLSEVEALLGNLAGLIQRDDGARIKSVLGQYVAGYQPEASVTAPGLIGTEAQGHSALG